MKLAILGVTCGANALADFFYSSFEIYGLGGRDGAVSVGTRRHAVNAFEVSDEMTLVSTTDASDDLFDAEKSGSEQYGGMLHAERFEISRGRNSGDGFEQITKVRG